MSGQKFRTDLVNLFRCGSKKHHKLQDSFGESLTSQTNCMSLTENDVSNGIPTAKGNKTE